MQIFKIKKLFSYIFKQKIFFKNILLYSTKHKLNKNNKFYWVMQFFLFNCNKIKDNIMSFGHACVFSFLLLPHLASSNLLLLFYLPIWSHLAILLQLIYKKEKYIFLINSFIVFLCVNNLFFLLENLFKTLLMDMFEFKLKLC
jgi:hypothetical protein